MPILSPAYREMSMNFIESIERICRVMECGVDDILEFVPEEKEGKEV